MLLLLILPPPSLNRLGAASQKEPVSPLSSVFVLQPHTKKKKTKKRKGGGDDGERGISGTCVRADGKGGFADTKGGKAL